MISPGTLPRVSSVFQCLIDLLKIVPRCTTANRAERLREVITGAVRQCSDIVDEMPEKERYEFINEHMLKWFVLRFCNIDSFNIWCEVCGFSDDESDIGLRRIQLLVSGMVKEMPEVPAIIEAVRRAEESWKHGLD